jgi:phosphate starvation-inducible PhoH-like protein
MASADACHRPPRTVTLQFDDNALLPLLYGEHDRHLAQIEQRAGVRLASRGNRLTITGSAEAAGIAEARRCARCGSGLERGESLAIAEVEAAMRLAEGEARSPADAPEPRLPLSDLRQIRTRKGAIGPRSVAQSGYMDLLALHEMVFGIGPAGTGKTYLAVAQGVALLMAGRVDRIVLSRPAVEAGERLGFLPGDMKEKVDPYLRPLYDALHDMMPAEQVAAAHRRRRDRDRAAGLHARPYPGPLLRHPGRGAEHHAGPDEDVPDPHGRGDADGHHGRSEPGGPAPGQKSGLVEAISICDDVPGIGFTHFDEQDVVRHPLVGRIVTAYGRAESGRGPPGPVRRAAGAPLGRSWMSPGSSLPDSGFAAAGLSDVEIVFAAPGWRGAVPRAEAMARRAVEAALADQGAFGAISPPAHRRRRDEAPERRIPRQGEGDQRALLPRALCQPDLGDLALSLGVVRREAAAEAPRRHPPTRISSCMACCTCWATTTSSPARPGAWSRPRRASCTGWACPIRGGG